jgi:hypothetical protein
LTTQWCRLLTFIHCSACRTASRCRATVVGSTRSSANSSSPPPTTTRRGSGHWRRADWLRVLDLWRADGHLQSWFWQHAVALSSSRRGGFSDGHVHWLGSSSGSLLSLRCHIFNGYRRRDIASLSLCTCRQMTTGSVIPGGYDYSSGSFAPEQSTHLQRR